MWRLRLGGEGKKIITDAYNVRSAFIHGGNQTKGAITYEDLCKISVDVDELIRKVLIKVIEQDSEVFTDEAKVLNLFDRLTFPDN